nr:MAG TPA: hypothetical protein [Caudoviricetes sp.]
MTTPLEFAGDRAGYLTPAQARYKIHRDHIRVWLTTHTQHIKGAIS